MHPTTCFWTSLTSFDFKITSLHKLNSIHHNPKYSFIYYQHRALLYTVVYTCQKRVFKKQPPSHTPSHKTQQTTYLLDVPKPYSPNHSIPSPTHSFPKASLTHVITIHRINHHMIWLTTRKRLNLMSNTL